MVQNLVRFFRLGPHLADLVEQWRALRIFNMAQNDPLERLGGSLEVLREVL